jgi:hypothetical protein
LIQLAAAFHQLMSRKSARGFLNNLDKSQEKLEVFEPEYTGVYIKPLLKFIELGKKEAGRLGEEKIEEFNSNLVPKLQFHKPSNPDLEIEIHEALRLPDFRQGIELFNSGYYWEAHEKWEDVWRDQSGDVRTFIQAFVQMAAAYSFVALSRPGAAGYLFEKTIEKFRQYENLMQSIEIEPLMVSMQGILRLLSDQIIEKETLLGGGVPRLRIRENGEEL